MASVDYVKHEVSFTQYVIETDKYMWFTLPM